MNWPTAFLLTQAIEMPFYLSAGRAWPWKKRLLVAFGASALTHPFVWFVFPELTQSVLELLGLSMSYKVPYWMAAETFAVVAEALWFRRCGLRQPWLWSLLGNGCSAGVGFLIHASRHLG